MRVSKRFPLAVHSMLFVAVLSPEKRVTSNLVAESTETNPVTVRNIFLLLSEKGLLAAAPGKNGGVHLAREAKDINLWDIYQAVEATNAEEIFRHQETTTTCPIGRNFYEVLSPHVTDVLNAVKEELEKISLESLKGELQSLLKAKNINYEDHAEALPEQSE